MAVTLSEIRVGFQGDGAGAGELTWGQLTIWLETQRDNRPMNLAWTIPPPAGASVTEVAAMLRFIVSRHPGLRTRLRFGAGPPGGRPEQVVAGSGEVPLHIADLGDGDDVAAAAEDLRSRYERTWFDYENEFPVRMGVIRQSGQVVRLVVCYSHVMVDGGGLLVLADDLAHLDWATGEATAPAAGLSPLELARKQDSPAGRRQSERAIRYWETQLARLPAGSGEHPRGRRLGVPELMACSSALELGMRMVAARTGADATSVLLAAYSAAVARVFGRDPAVALIPVTNRFRPGLASTVSQVAQLGICVVDVAGAPFGEVVARAQKAMTGASFYAYYDPVACGRLLDETAARRGQPLGLDWWVNDLRGMVTPAGAAAGLPTEAELEQALPRTRLYWNREATESHGTFYLFVDSAPERVRWQAPAERLPAVYLKVWVDTCQFEPEQAEAFVREMEGVVVAAAFGTQAVGSAR